MIKIRFATLVLNYSSMSQSHRRDKFIDQ